MNNEREQELEERLIAAEEQIRALQKDGLDMLRFLRTTREDLRSRIALLEPDDPEEGSKEWKAVLKEAKPDLEAEPCPHCGSRSTIILSGSRGFYCGDCHGRRPFVVRTPNFVIPPFESNAGK